MCITTRIWLIFFCAAQSLVKESYHVPWMCCLHWRLTPRPSLHSKYFFYHNQKYSSKEISSIFFRTAKLESPDLKDHWMMKDYGVRKIRTSTLSLKSLQLFRVASSSQYNNDFLVSFVTLPPSKIHIISTYNFHHNFPLPCFTTHTNLVKRVR